jgi:type IV pilus assembly protein PilV
MLTMRSKQAGISLVEVLITLLIIGIGLLGLLGMQAKSLVGQKDSIDRKAAAELIAQMAERMRSNHLGFMNDAYSSTLLASDAIAAGPTCGVTTACNTNETAQLDVRNWQTAVRARLADSAAFIVTSPGAGASMSVDGTSVTVTLAWREAQVQQFVDNDCVRVGVTDKMYRCLSAEVFP